MACSLPYQVLQYGADRDLQRVGVWEVKPILPVPPNSYWVMYVAEQPPSHSHTHTHALTHLTPPEFSETYTHRRTEVW